MFFSQLSTSTTDTITPSQPLHDNGTTLVSDDGTFELGFFSPGSSTNRYIGIWYKIISVKTVVWVANRDNPIKDNTNSTMLTITKEGNLVLINNNNNQTLWSTNVTILATQPLFSPMAQLLNTGNLVVEEGSNNNNSEESFLWQSFDHPCDTLLPGMKLGWDLKTGNNRKLTAWKSWDDPSPGKLSWGMLLSSNPELVQWKGSIEYYRSGPWNGLRFSGQPVLRITPVVDGKFINDSNEVYYSYTLTENSVISITYLNQTLSLRQRIRWIPENKTWRVYESLPRDDCDPYNTCGPNGNCMVDESPVCQCLEGFQPKIPQNWNTLDWTEGCVRTKPWSCRVKNQDGFHRFASMKVPDTRNSWIYENMTLEDCKAKCLENCSCMAYSNLDIREDGSGCSIWFGDLIDLKLIQASQQDLYIRMAVPDATSNGNTKKKALVIAIPLVSVTILLLVILYIYRSRRNHKGKLLTQTDSRLRIIHRDLKASNILLDDDMNPKISDFGLARLCGNDQIEGNTNKVVGTYGYMAPEYAINGLFSIKSDVFSFGILLLEIISGKKNRGLTYTGDAYNLIGHAWRLWKEGDPTELIDDCLGDSYVISEALRCIQVSLLCLQYHPDDRPNMASVVVMLTNETNLAQPKEPGFLIERIVPVKVESSTGKQISSSVNEVSISLLDAR
ncbi:hypothetical protein Fmac_011796 [Flemingia macrophylla]|uniref:non-specific serine/threonine protein kinase n=1 Tax=Flemingia macrophylla TaxID=520843 RepID=A0ABD1MNG6_9FABA